MNVQFLKFKAYKAVKGSKDKPIIIRLDLIAAIEPKTDHEHNEVGTVLHMVGGSVLGVAEKISEVQLKMGMLG